MQCFEIFQGWQMPQMPTPWLRAWLDMSCILQKSKFKEFVSEERKKRSSLTKRFHISTLQCF